MLLLEAWPAIVAFLLILFLQVRIRQQKAKAVIANSSSNPQTSHPAEAFQVLQRKFLPVFAFMVFGDRLRNGLRTPFDGYLRLGFYPTDAKTLYILPFSVTGWLGPLCGACADAFGRKLMSMAFCIVSAISSGLHASSMGCFDTLTIARYLDGISLAIMATTFEAWYVQEFTLQSKLPVDRISVGFSSWTLWSTMAAILALVGELATMALVDTGNAGVFSFILPFPPYILAVLVFVVGIVLIGMQWNENCGLADPEEDLHRGRRTAVVIRTIRDALQAIYQDWTIIWLGCVQMMFEIGAALVFTSWLVRIGAIIDAPGPFYVIGLEMGTYLACIIIGCLIYRLYYSESLQQSVGCVGRASALLLVSCMLMALVSKCQTSRRSHEYVAAVGTLAKEILEGTSGFGEYLTSRTAFLLFGLSMGLYWPAMSTIRSYVLPNNLRSTIIALYRAPLSLLVFHHMAILAMEESDPYRAGEVQIAAGGFGILALCSAKILLSHLGQKPSIVK